MYTISGGQEELNKTLTFWGKSRGAISHSKYHILKSGNAALQVHDIHRLPNVVFYVTQITSYMNIPVDDLHTPNYLEKVFEVLN